MTWPASVVNPTTRSRAVPGSPTEEHEGRLLADLSRVRWWGEYLAHVQNEQRSGKRHHTGIAAGQGVSKGFPDYVLELAAWGWHGLRIELKRTTGGRQTTDQAAWQLRHLRRGYLSVVAPGGLAAAGWCEWYAGRGGDGDRWPIDAGGVRAIPMHLPPAGRAPYPTDYFLVDTDCPVLDLSHLK